MAKNEVLIPEETIQSKIYLIRGEKVMLDSDLAELYEVETKVLKQAVRRNIDIFPNHFMFELTKDENEVLRSPTVTSKEGRGGTRYLPMVFTEHGVLQLANVLRSKRAKQVSIRIIEIFVKMRQILANHTELLKKLEELESKVSGHDEQFALIFEYTRQFEQAKREELEQKQRTQIGYKNSKKEE